MLKSNSKKATVKKQPSVEESESTLKSKLTDEEKQAAQKENEDSATTEKIQLASDLVSRKFNLDSSYRVTQFKDNGKCLTISLENEEFSLSITAKDADMPGLHVIEYEK